MKFKCGCAVERSGMTRVCSAADEIWDTITRTIDALALAVVRADGVAEGVAWDEHKAAVTALGDHLKENRTD